MKKQQKKGSEEPRKKTRKNEESKNIPKKGKWRNPRKTEFKTGGRETHEKVKKKTGSKKTDEAKTRAIKKTWKKTGSGKYTRRDEKKGE